jgi:hypothetical protein
MGLVIILHKLTKFEVFVVHRKEKSCISFYSFLIPVILSFLNTILEIFFIFITVLISRLIKLHILFGPGEMRLETLPCKVNCER